MNNTTNKRFFDCEATFKRRFDKKNSDLIYLDVTYNESLLTLIKEVCVLDEKAPLNNDYTADSGLIRYKIKNAIFSSLSSMSRDLIFSCELIDNKKASYSFATLHYLEIVEENIKTNLASLCRIIKNMNITYKMVISEA